MRLGRAGAAADCPDSRPSSGAGRRPRASVARIARAGLEVVSFDSRRYENPLVADIGLGDIRELRTLEGFAWVVTNLPYEALEELATHLIDLGVRSGCSVALLVRAEWSIPKARRKLIHEHPHFAGAAMLTARPRRVEKTQELGVSAAQFRMGPMGRDAAGRRSLALSGRCCAGFWTPAMRRSGRRRRDRSHSDNHHTRRMTSGELLKYRNGLLMVQSYHAHRSRERLV